MQSKRPQFNQARKSNTYWQIAEHPFTLPASRFDQLSLANNTDRKEVIDTLIKKGCADSVSELFRRTSKEVAQQLYSNSNFDLIIERLDQENWPLYNLRAIVEGLRSRLYSSSHSLQLGHFLYNSYWYKDHPRTVTQLELLQLLKNIIEDRCQYLNGNQFNSLLKPDGFLHHMSDPRQDIWGDMLTDFMQEDNYAKYLPQSLYLSYAKNATLIACEGVGGKRLFAQCFNALTDWNKQQIQKSWTELECVVLPDIIKQFSNYKYLKK